MSNEEINLKAKELVEKYMNVEFGLIQVFLPNPSEFAKQCAISTCDILMENAYDLEFFHYWGEIKNAIEEL